MSDTILKYLSMAVLAYITILIVVSYTSFENDVFRAAAELITIPALMFALGCFVFSVFKVMRKERSYIQIAVINFASVLLSVLSSILE